jgi:hypothetical protein
MSNKKQTAFEWYMEQHNILVQVCDKMPVDERFERFSSLVDKVKEMEKKQMWEYIKKNYCIGPKSLEFHRLEFQQYYNETYGGKNESK